MKEGLALAFVVMFPLGSMYASYLCVVVVLKSS